MSEYNHKKIEPKWQEKWETDHIYKTTESSDKPKKYVLDMFPYPSGEGLHVGHPKGYIATDVFSRLMRMRGHNVLHPMGWDAFGLPAENYAIKTKTHPREAVDKNVARYKKQLQILGPDYDWSREINTTDPEYYKWTQWIFIQLFKKGLAYESHEPINWCPSCQTGLANEDLENGVCERCGSEVEKKPIRQWVLKIREYADRLLEDLEKLSEWPEYIKEQQRNWIGRSDGAEIEFPVKDTNKSIRIFTTRPDTIFGATYMVLAPEHPLLGELKYTNTDAVRSYQEETKKKTEIERSAEGKEKTGVQLEGVVAINPANKEEIPIFIADYVLPQYGTGAIMAVPAHDERDHEFAKKFSLPIPEVVAPNFELTGDAAFREDTETLERDTVSAIIENVAGDAFLILDEGDQHVLCGGGVDEGETPEEGMFREMREETGYVNAEIKSIVFNNLFCKGFRSTKQKNQITKDVFYHIKLLDDERVASEDDGDQHTVRWIKKEDVSDYITWEHHKFVWESFVDSKPFTGSGILVNSGEFDGLSSEEAKEKITEFVGGELKTTYRLQDWVFARQRYWGEPIPIIHCEKCGAVPVPEEQLPVTLPNVEHYEPTGTGESPLASIEDWVNVECPKCGGVGKRETNTMPQWAGSSWYYLRYMDPQNNDELVAPENEKYWSPVDLYVGGAEHATRHLIYARFWHKFLFDISVVSTEEPFMKLHSVGLIQAEDGRKMSKRWGNVINPDDVVAQHGADSLRVYEMFMGPFENAIAWSTDGLVGARRFVERVWGLQDKLVDGPVESLEMALNQTIKKVGEDIEEFKFNTAISQMMIFVNAVDKEGQIGKEQYETFLKVLAPFAPHITEELWHVLGNENSIHLESWPTYDEAKTQSGTVIYAVQVNGKLRANLEMTRGADKDAVEQAARELKEIKKWVEGEPEKVIHVPDRLINFVV